MAAQEIRGVQKCIAIDIADFEKCNTIFVPYKIYCNILQKIFFNHITKYDLTNVKYNQIQP